MASKKEEFSSDPYSATTSLPDLESLSLKDTPHQELTVQIDESLLHVQDHGSFQLDGRGFSLGGSKGKPKKTSFKRQKLKSSQGILPELGSLSLEDTPSSKDETNQGHVDKLLIQVEDNETLFCLDGRGFNLGSSNEQPRKHRSACLFNKENRHKRNLFPHTTGIKLTRVPFPLNVSHVTELVTESDRIECKARMRKARDEESSSAKVCNIEIENDNMYSREKKPVELDDPDVVSPVSQHQFFGDRIKQSHSKRGKKIFHSMKVEDPIHEDDKDLSDDLYDGGVKSNQESLKGHTLLKDADKKEKKVPVDISGRTLSQIKKTTKTRIHPTEFNNNDILHVGVYAKEIIAKLEHQYKFNYLTQDLFDSNLYLILIEACKRGSLDVVKYFTTRLSQFFDINKVFVYTYEYIVPVHCKPDTEWIISNAHTKPLGNTILHLAAAHHHLEIVKYIVELGAKVDVVDCCGHTALMRGIANLPIVEYLITARSNVNHQTQYGMTPLMISVKEPRAKGIVECLLKAGADPTVMDKCGRTCIHYLLPTYRKHEVDLLLANTPLPDSRMGTLSCAGRPLFFYDFKNEDFNLLFHNPHLSLVQKASIKFLYVVAKMKSYHGSLVELLQKAIQYKEENQVKFEYPLLLEAYGNRHEVQTADDIDKLIRLSDIEIESKLKIEINFQCLLISDRLCGYGSYKSLYIQSDILDIMAASHYSTTTFSLESPESKENCLKLYKLHVELLHRFAEICGPFLEIKTLIVDAIKKAISLYSVFKFELNQDWLDIHSELTYAVVVYCKNTSYSHIHHPTYCPNEDSIAKIWMEYLLGISSKGHYEWIFPIFKLLYKELDFVYLSKGMPTTLFYEMIYSLPDCKPEHLQDCVNVCGDHILNVPSMGRYPIHSVPSHLLPALILLGPHPDVVDHKGQKPCQNISNDYRNPLSLYCRCATSIVQYHLCYENLDLPSHVKHFIGLHDPKVHVTQYCKHLGIIKSR